MIIKERKSLRIKNDSECLPEDNKEEQNTNPIVDCTDNMNTGMNSISS